MKTYTLKCPNCEANLEVDDGINTFFCKYCGRQIIVEGQSDAEIKAKLKMKEMAHDTEVKEKQFAHEKEMKEKQFAQERYKIKQEQKESTKANIFPFLIPIILIIVSGLSLSMNAKENEKASNAQEAQLEALVDEIMIDVENHNFDEAYVKANSLYYTEGWSESIEEKWNETRGVVIEYIEDSEKQAKKEAKAAEKQAKKEAKAAEKAEKAAQKEAEKQAKKEAFEAKKQEIFDTISEKKTSITDSISEKTEGNSFLDFLPF